MVLSKNERADAIVRLATEPRLLALSLAGLAGLDIGKLGFGAFICLLRLFANAVCVLQGLPQPLGPSYVWHRR